MAFLGAQLVITMVMASFLQKIMPYISLSSWILCKRLVRYLHPTDQMLKVISGKPTSTSGKRNRNKKDSSKSDSNSGFNVSKSVDIPLEVAPIEPSDIIHLHFYPEFHWLLNFSFTTLVVYALSEVYYYLSPSAKNEINLSMLWAFLVILFSLKTLCSLTALYFRNESTQGERSMTLVCGSSFFLLAMIVLITDEQVLEFGLIDAHASLSEKAAIFLSNHGIEVTGSSSKLTFKFVLALWSGIIGAFFTFPGMRGAKMHVDSLNYTEGAYFMKTLLHLNLASMLLLPLLWLKPLTRNCLTTTKCSSKLEKPLMNDDQFDSLRFYIIFLVVLLRLILIPRYLQSYLNIAYDRVKQLKKEAGRINSLELQRKVARIFYYLCVVALQYISPILVCLYMGLMLKTLGGYAWHPNFIQVTEDNLTSANETSLSAVFTQTLYRGILNYLTWWCCTTLSITTSLGFLYYSYFLTN